MLKKITLSALAAAILSAGGAAYAAEGGHVEDYAFSFEGPFGTWDKAQLQRGLQIYTEVCSSCHGMKFVPIRTLTDLGYSEAQVRAYASQIEVVDADTGETRPAIPADHFPPSAVANAPDLSVMAKARAGFHGPYGTGLSQLFRGIGGPEYIASLLNGYTGETREVAGTTFYENKVFPGGWIAMPPPLSGDDVEFADGHSTELESEAKDIAAFLNWTAEPKLMVRKKFGFVAVVMMVVLTVLLYLTNKRIWAPVKGKETA